MRCHVCLGGGASCDGAPVCCLAGGGERAFEEDVACVFGRLDSEEVPAEVAYSTDGGV